MPQQFTREQIRELAQYALASLDTPIEVQVGSRSGTNEYPAISIPTSIDGIRIDRDMALVLMSAFADGADSLFTLPVQSTDRDGNWYMLVDETAERGDFIDNLRRNLQAMIDSPEDLDRIADLANSRYASDFAGPPDRRFELAVTSAKTTLEEKAGERVISVVRSRNNTRTVPDVYYIGATDEMEGDEQREARKQTRFRDGTGADETYELTDDFKGEAYFNAGRGSDTFRLSAEDITSISFDTELDEGSYTVRATTRDGGTVEISSIERLVVDGQELSLQVVEQLAGGVEISGDDLSQIEAPVSRNGEIRTFERS